MKGKDKCEFLKEIRKRMAEANGIPYEPRKCTYEGDCTGTCPFCEKETADLMVELRKKEAEGVDIKTGVFPLETCEDVARIIQHDKKRIEESEELKGSLVNSSQDLLESQFPPIPPIDSSEGSKNPIMSERQFNDMKCLIEEQMEPLMGDIRQPYVEPTEEEKMTRLQLEEKLREEDEMGEIRPNRLESLLKQIKKFKTQGLIEEE